MKLVIGTTLWKRASIERLCLRQLKIALQHEQLDVVFVAVGSEGDESRARAEEHGWVYEEFPNSPLGAKHNRMAQAAKDLNADALMTVGSDNWITRGWVDHCMNALAQGHPAVGLRDVYFVHRHTQEVVYWEYPRDHPRHGEPIGPGRVLSRDCLQSLHWHPWDDEYERNMDGSCTKALERIGVQWHGVLGRDIDTVCVDWKGEESLSSFDAFRNTGVAVEYDLVMSRFQ